MKFFDTNILLSHLDKVWEEDSFIISGITYQELENIKSSSKKSEEVKYKARQAIRWLSQNKDKYKIVVPSLSDISILKKFDLEDTPDNRIICDAYYLNQKMDIIFVTNDLLCGFIAETYFNLKVENIITDINNYYTGYKDVTLSDEEMSYFYLHQNENIYDCLLNEYLIVRKSNGEVVDYKKWNGTEYKSVNYKQINSKFIGKIKPKNPEQVLAFDLLQNKDITIKIIQGKFGTGKTYLCISNALKLIEDGQYDKFVFIRNPIGVKNIAELGFLPGDLDEKLRPTSMVLADHLGGEIGLETNILNGTISIEYIGNIRGRDYKNCILYCNEAENLTKEHVQLLIGRIAEGSTLWLDGDFKQVDDKLFESNNGLMIAVDRLKDHDKFGCVKLQKTERSETAAMADLLD